MERDQKPIVNTMLRTLFTETIFKTICILLGNRVYKIYDSIKIDCNKELSPEMISEIKNKHFHKILKEDHIQKEMTTMLNEIQKNKSDVLAEVLKQHSMHDRDESTYYHDFLQNIFDMQVWKVRMLVKNHCFKELFN